MTAITPDRVAWTERQLLASGDLRLAQRFLDILRARHMRGAHGTWGVALGLLVRLQAGADAVQIGAGLAYDAAGRELLIATPVEIHVPAAATAAGSFVVVLRSASEPCVPQAEVRIVTSDDELALGRDVPIAEVDVATSRVDIERRPHVRSLAPPTVCCGTVPAGSVAVQGSALSFSARIETSAAGMQDTPQYLVQPLSRPTTAASPLGPLLAVSEASPDGFALEAHYVFATRAECEQALRRDGKVRRLPFDVVWVGVALPPACGVSAAPEPECPCLP